MSDTPVGTFCLVLHSHLPWLSHHGSWPVGEEWLYQAWSTSYLRVVEVLESLAADGRRSLVTLGVTPVLAASLDDPYTIQQQHAWLADWQLRANGMAASSDPQRRRTGEREHAEARHAMALFEGSWQRGASPILRRLEDAGIVELLGGPAMHPFQPLVDPAIARASLRIGLDDRRVRFGLVPDGIWAPECGYRPGLEQLYADLGVRHFLVDGPTLAATGAYPGQGWRVGASDVVAFARDLDVTYRVWSPRKGYPGAKWYRDFHTFDHEWGMRPARVTGASVPPHEKAPYEPDRASAQVTMDARDFVDTVVGRLRALADDPRRPDTSPPVVVAAFDTELFGHWWHEGPEWLRQVLCALPEAGVRVSTLRDVRDTVNGCVELGPGSWGSGKDWRVWDGAQVTDVVADQQATSELALKALRQELDANRQQRRRDLDQLLRELLLGLSSDWAFMITKDSAARYARGRSDSHLASARELAAALMRGDPHSASAAAARLHRQDYVLGGLDARVLDV